LDVDTDLKIILLVYYNNYVGRSSWMLLLLLCW